MKFAIIECKKKKKNNMIIEKYINLKIGKQKNNINLLFDFY